MTTEPTQKHSKRRYSTVFDAVAGRVGTDGFLSTPRASKYRDTARTSATAAPPEEVLFREKYAPVRYEEDDVYSADRHLKDHQRLPDSDLLKAIHAYASHFYATQMDDREASDFRSLDETALIAMGILLEEMAGKAVGRSGYLDSFQQSGERDGG